MGSLNIHVDMLKTGRDLNIPPGYFGTWDRVTKYHCFLFIFFLFSFCSLLDFHNVFSLIIQYNLPYVGILRVYI